MKVISRNIPKRMNEENLNSEKSEKNTLKENLKNKLPTYNMVNLSTNLKIFDKKTYGQVTENAKFVLKNGSFTSIIRKISLAGSSDSIIAFKVSSK